MLAIQALWCVCCATLVHPQPSDMLAPQSLESEPLILIDSTRMAMLAFPDMSGNVGFWQKYP